MLPKPGARLDLAQLHSSVHNLVLSRREDVGFWRGPLETAWAGFVFAGHSLPSQDEITINLIKGELLGEKCPSNPRTPSELAACYMVAAFLQRIEAVEFALELLTTTNARVLEIAANIDLGERFHLLSTPEYLYAIVLAHYVTGQPMPDEIRSTVSNSLARIKEVNWHQSGYVFALAATAYLIVDEYSEAACQDVLGWLSVQLKNTDQIDEHSIPLVWFLEINWISMRSHIGKTDAQRIDNCFIRFRSRLLHSLGQFDFQLAWSPPMEIQYDKPANEALLIVGTIELLMLDEIAEKHSQQSFVLTQEEVDRHSLLSSVFDQYKLLVDNKLAVLGLGDHLDAVYRGLEDDNPGSWQTAVLGCRNIFYALSETLWKVTGDTYAIPGQQKPLSVKAGSGKEKNRLAAYLHYSGISRSKDPVFMAQFEAVHDLMHALVDKTAKAKYAITRNEALSLLIATYVVLAEMIVLTGLEPVADSTNIGHG